MMKYEFNPTNFFAGPGLQTHIRQTIMNGMNYELVRNSERILSSQNLTPLERRNAVDTDRFEWRSLQTRVI